MKAIKWIVKFIYKYSGVEWVVFEIGVRVNAYRVRLNIVPVSYKLFLVLVGVSIGAGYMYVYQNHETVWSFENTSAPVIVEQAHASTEVTIEPVLKETTIEELADIIHLRESTKGKNNYSQCEKIGKFNEYGFGIPGDGSFLCFDKGMDRVAVLGWLAQHRAMGMSDKAMLCLYSGNNYKECK
jgi:hypothetical protein